MDLAKYRAVFLEEATEHLAEISHALLELEKGGTEGESSAIDLVFRMAHSIKGMAASLGYDSITEVSHALEDRMQAIRSAGTVGGELGILFAGLETLEAMVAVVRETGEAPASDSSRAKAFLARLVDPAESAAPPPRAGEEIAQAAPNPNPPAASDAATRPLETALAPPPTVRVQTDVLDRFLSTVGEVILGSSQVRTAIHASARAGATNVSVGLDRMDRVVGELQRRALDLRTTPLQRIVAPLPRVAREVAQRAGKRVEVEIRGAELELDRSILDRLSDPLVHLLRNAVDHGIETPDVRTRAGKDETGHVTIDARRARDSISISVCDDGAGVDLDSVRARAVRAGLVHEDLASDLPPDQIAALVFYPGVSTADNVSEISGRGVGMDAVRATIESLGGSVELTSEHGRGTTTTIIVPVTAAVQRVLVLQVGGETVAIPVARVERIVEIAAEEIERAGGEGFALVDDELVPVLTLAHELRIEPGEGGAVATIVLTDVRGDRVALEVERVVGQQQIYVKPVPELLTEARALAGLTILGDGHPVFLLDLNQLA